MKSTYDRTITDYIDREVKEYAISVVEDRAIPSIVDGFKPVQRKIAFTANKVAKSLVKTAALVGNVISIGGYYKGDSSIAEACGKMAQDFPGSNNFAFIEGEGEFGKRLTPNGISAPRYTKSRIHPNFGRFFIDNELLQFDEQDGEFFEPRYYLPIIPTVLLNGVAGIAVGFAVKILPYNLKDIIYNVSQVVLGKEQQKMIPYWEGFKGSVTPEEDGGFTLHGIWNKINTTTIEITELPIGISRDKYVDHLNDLEDKGHIKGYDDLCKKEFKFIIYMKREILAQWEERGQVEAKFKLVKKVSENLNLISENGKLVYFENPNQIIEHFVRFRMGVVVKRKEYFLRLYDEKITFALLKIAFIQEVMNGKIDFKSIKNKGDLREKVAKLMKSHKPTEDDIDKLINISIYSLTKEEIIKLNEQSKEWRSLIEYYEKTPEKKLFLKDLVDLAKEMKIK